MNKWTKRLGIATAHGFEYYNIAVYSAIQTYIALLFFPETIFGQNAELFAWLPFILRFISRPFGGIFVGIYADRYGRKSALVFTSGLTGCATLIMGLLPTYAELGLVAPILFFIMHLVYTGVQLLRVAHKPQYTGSMISSYILHIFSWHILEF